MRKADIVSAGLIVVSGLAVLFYVIPTWVPVILDGDYGLGARDMPMVAAVTLTGLAALFLVDRLRAGSKAGGGKADGEAGDDAPPPISAANWRFLLLSGTFLIAMTALFEYAGFLVAGPPTIAGFMLMMGERRWLHIVGTALVATGAIWIFFWQILRFPLP